MVEWNILLNILVAHGFDNLFYILIWKCVLSSFFSVGKQLSTWSPHGFFPSSCGIRQGDLLSPTLFTFFAYLFSMILLRAEQKCRINGVVISRTSPRVSHMMYADDLIVYYKADLIDTKEVKKCLNMYCL